MSMVSLPTWLFDVAPVGVADVVRRSRCRRNRSALVSRTPVVLYGAGNVNLPREGSAGATRGRAAVPVADSTKPPGAPD